MELGEADSLGWRSPVPIPDSNFVLPANTMIVSIGNSPNSLILAIARRLAATSNGTIIVNENGLTSREGIYAGGDIVTGAPTVISAVGAGKRSAKAICL